MSYISQEYFAANQTISEKNHLCGHLMEGVCACVVNFHHDLVIHLVVAFDNCLQHFTQN